jgi:membrane protease YdiL (CAAX protease family)
MSAPDNPNLSNQTKPLVEGVPPPPSEPPAAGVDRIFIGPNGLRAGWRICIWLSISIALAAVSVEIVVHVPFLKQLLPGPKSGLSPWGLIVSEGSIFWTVLVAALVMSAIEGRKPGIYGLPKSQAFGKYFWQGILWGLAMISLLVGMIAATGGYNFGAIALNSSTIVQNGILFGIGFLFVGFFEEFTFRGYFQFTLATGIKFWPAAITTSLLFAAIHTQNGGETPAGIVSVFVIGFFFCVTLWRTGNLWFAIGLHCAFDWGETFLYSLPDSGNPAVGALSHATLHGPGWITGGTAGPEASAFCFLTMGLAFLVFPLVYRARPPLPAAGESSAPAISQ